MLDKNLHKLLAPVITGLGYELLGIQRLAQGRRGWLIRVIIDSPAGIGLNDCERVSRQVSGVLEVEDPITGHYTLEVSSPGLERPLFTLEHFCRFVGRKVQIRLSRPVESRRVFTGILQQVEDNTVIVIAEGDVYRLPYEQIDKAHLVYDP